MLNLMVVTPARGNQNIFVSEMKMKYTIIGLGEILWDMFPAGKNLGGAPANFAYHAHALGHKGVIVSAVGDDELGHEIIEQLQHLCLTCDYIAIDKTKPTGTVSVYLDEKGQPTYTIHEGVAWDFIPNMPSLIALADKADAVCFGSLAQRSEVSRHTIRDFLDKVSSKPLRIFDVNLRQAFYTKAIIESSLQRANVLKINDEELPIIANLLDDFSAKDEHRALKTLARHYDLRLVALTKGDKGSILYANEQFATHPGCASTQSIVDTVGAGDAFTAALAIGMLKGYDLERLNKEANCLAAFVCSRAGATPTLPDELIEPYFQS